MRNTKTTQGLKRVLELNPGPWRWWVGLQASLAIGLPIAVFTVAGLPMQGIIASLGGFTGLYCAQMRRRHRLRVLPFLALGFVGVSLLGVWCAGNLWLNFAFLVVAGTATAVLALGYAVGPPGPLMFVLVYAISGRIYLNQHLQQHALGVFYIPLLVAIGALLAFLVVVSPLLSGKVRRSETASGAFQEPQRFTLPEEVRWVAGRIVAGLVLASLTGTALGIDRNYWVVISALAVLQSGWGRWFAVVRALQRVAGTLIGILIFGMLYFLKPSGIGLVLTVMLLQFAIEVVVMRNYGLALVFITPLALTIASAAHPGHEIGTVYERVWDIVIGSGIGLLVFLASEWVRLRIVKFPAGDA